MVPGLTAVATTCVCRLKPFLQQLNAPQYKLLLIYYNRALESRKAQRSRQQY
jgi:hypothetical protein